MAVVVVHDGITPLLAGADVEGRIRHVAGVVLGPAAMGAVAAEDAVAAARVGNPAAWPQRSGRAARVRGCRRQVAAGVARQTDVSPTVTVVPPDVASPRAGWAGEEVADGEVVDGDVVGREVRAPHLDAVASLRVGAEVLVGSG